jgi:hypothetical protein
MDIFSKIKEVSDAVSDFSSLLQNKKKTGKTFKEECFYAVGTPYYEDNIVKILKQNKEYRTSARALVKSGRVNQNIYKYERLNTNAKLIPDPKNEHDKNAVQVCISGKLVGFIKREETLRVKKILGNSYIEYITAFVSGGESKIVFPNKDVYKNDGNFNIKIKIGYYS